LDPCFSLKGGGGEVDGDGEEEGKHETEKASVVVVSSSHFAQQKAGKRPEESAVTNHFNVVKP
jgi:hypothetical protein